MVKSVGSEIHKYAKKKKQSSTWLLPITISFLHCESTSIHDNKKFRTRSVEKQTGMAFGFRKMATAVVQPDRQIESDVSVSKIVLHVYLFIIIGIQPLGRSGQRPEFSQATGMALVCCILGKFLGVACHCFPPYMLRT